MGGWPGVVTTMLELEAIHVIHSILHLCDIILVFAEITVLMIMVLSFLGAGNRTQQRVAQRWVKGKTAPIFWLGMIGLGLVVPLLCNISGLDGLAFIACILVLCGGCLLRFLCVWSDDRQPLDGENKYYFRQKHADVDYSKLWVKPAKEMERGQTFEYIDNLY
jgi:polysulfide reductase chain C